MADRIEKFLKTYNSNHTKMSYRHSLIHFFNSVYGKGKLEDQADKYFKEKRNYEEDIENFFVSLQSKPPKVIKLRMSIVKTFLSENDIEIPDKFYRRLRKRKIGRASCRERV